MHYAKIQSFIGNEMRMSQVYQPVMLIELLKNKLVIASPPYLVGFYFSKSETFPFHLKTIFLSALRISLFLFG